MLFTRYAKNVLVALFAMAIWLPLLVMLVTPERQISEFENRRLASLPELNFENPRKLADNFENYLNDHFGFREHLIRLFRILEVQVFHVSQAGQVIFGKDDWLFEAGHRQIADMRNNWPFDTAQLEEWGSMLSAKHDRLEKEGIAYLFLFAPNKHLVYPEKLPASVNRVRELSRVDQLVDYLEEHTDVPFLDPREPLFEAKKQLRPYHRTDTHWNAWGAYVGYLTVIEYLRQRFPELQAVELNADDFAKRKTPGINLARTISMQDQLTEIEIYPEKWQPTCAVYEGLPENFTRLDMNNNPFITRCKKGHKRLLIFRDSYSLDMVPYLSETFKYIYYYHKSPVPLKGMLRVIEQHNPDIVIEERSTRWLRKPYG